MTGPVAGSMVGTVAVVMVTKARFPLRPSAIELGLSGNRAFGTNTNDTVSIIGGLLFQVGVGLALGFLVYVIFQAAMTAGSRGLRASNSSVTRGRPPVMS